MEEIGSIMPQPTRPASTPLPASKGSNSVTSPVCPLDNPTFNEDLVTVDYEFNKEEREHNDNIDEISYLLRNTAILGSIDRSTHAVLGNPSIYWQVQDDRLSEFWATYCNIIMDGRQANIAEMPDEHMPVVARFVFNFRPMSQKPKVEDIFANRFAGELILCYQQAMAEKLRHTSTNMAIFLCCVLTSPDLILVKAGKEEFYRYEIRLHFPYCLTNIQTQLQVLRPRVIEILRQHNGLRFLNCEPVNNWEDILLDSVNKPLPLYGSSDDESMPPVKFNFATDVLDETSIDKNDLPTRELSEVFFISNHKHIVEGLVTQNMFNLDNEDGLLKWLPLFLSINYHTQVTYINKNNRQFHNEQHEEEFKVFAGLDCQYIEEMQEMALIFLDMLDTKRASKLNNWRDIGRAIYNIYNGEDEGLQQWARYTTLHSDVYNATHCRAEYGKFGIDNHLSVKTLAIYASWDNPDKYNAWHLQWCAPTFEKALTRTHQSVANAFYKMYWLKFYYSDTDIWYRFDRNHLVPDPKGRHVHKAITGEFLHYFRRLRTQYSIRVQQSEDPNEQATGETIISKIGQLIKTLENDGFINALTRRLADSFYLEDFERIRNKNDNVIGILNGVIESNEKESTYRQGKPEDFITLCLPVGYYHQYNWNHPEIRVILNWFAQMFPDKELYHHVFKICASCLVARNRDKIFPILTGEGDNGKSMFKKLMQATFGVRLADLPTKLFTSNAGFGGGPTPELAQLAIALAAFFEEPNNSSATTLQDGIIKKITGGDSMFARFLHDNGGTMKINFILFLICNKIPRMHNQKATRSRVRVIPFMGLWSDEAPDDPNEQRKRWHYKSDVDFEEKIPYMAPGFLWILVQYYRKYKAEGLGIPDIVRRKTDDYWRKNDLYLKFIEECLEKVYMDPLEKTMVNESVMMSTRDMWSDYKAWFRSTYSDTHSLPDFDFFEEEIASRLKEKPVNGGWIGWRSLMSIGAI